MKTSVKIVMLASVVFCSVSFVWGQNVPQNNPTRKKLIQKLNTMTLPAGFRAGLQWQKFIKPRQKEKSTNQFTYHIDTAVVQAGGEFDKRYLYSYDSAGNTVSVLSQTVRQDVWTNSSLDTMTYDSVGNRLTNLVKVWNNDTWQNLSLDVFRYIENRKVSSQISKVWKNDAWVYSDSSSYYYDVNDNVAAAFNATWVDSLSVWLNHSFNLYSYDSMGYRQFSLYEQWLDSTWVNAQKVIYSYDSTYNLSRGLILYWGDTAWINFYRENYFYDSIKNKTAYTGQVWDTNDSVWDNDLHYDYGYDEYNQLELGVGKTWNDSVWENFEKGEFTYDRFGGIETYLHQQWLDGDTSWQNSSMTLYSYDSAGNAYQGKFFTWDTVQQNWIQNQSGLMKIFYNYGTLSKFYTGYQVDIKYNKPLSTGVAQQKNSVLNFGCAPNPARQHTTILLDVKNKETIQMDVYDITGRKMASVFRGQIEKGKHNFTLNTDSFPSGLYFVAIRSGNTMKTLKLVVENK